MELSAFSSEGHVPIRTNSQNRTEAREQNTTSLKTTCGTDMRWDDFSDGFLVSTWNAMWVLRVA